MSLDLRLVLERAFEGRMEFGLAFETLRQTGSIHREQRIERHAGRVNCRLGILGAREIHASMRLYRGLSNLRAKIQVCALIANVQFRFHLRD